MMTKVELQVLATSNAKGKEKGKGKGRGKEKEMEEEEENKETERLTDYRFLKRNYLDFEVKVKNGEHVRGLKKRFLDLIDANLNVEQAQQESEQETDE
jgi:hypothetical protein